jgi:hypothetical protein
MTPRDRGVQILVSDPSLLGRSVTTKIEAQILLYNPRLTTLTDAVYELRDGRIAMAELSNRYFEPIGRMSKPGTPSMVRTEFPHTEQIPRQISS